MMVFDWFLDYMIVISKLSEDPENWGKLFLREQTNDDVQRKTKIFGVFKIESKLR